MENNTVEKKAKSKSKVSTTAAIRVRVETRKKIIQEVARANKKDFGKRIRPEDVIALAMSLLTPGHVQTLQESSLSNADKLEKEYRNYIGKNGHISKDAYLGKRLSGEISQENAPKSLSDPASKSA
jgi:hypothetical protein